MSLLSDLFSKKITTITKEHLNGVENIKPYCFSHLPLLTEVTLPDSVKNIGTMAFASCESLSKVTFGKNVSYIGITAFGNCTSLEYINAEDINPYCLANNSTLYSLFETTKWNNDHSEGSMITIAKGKILVDNKITTPSSGFEIPNTVVNLMPYSCRKYGDTVDSNFTSVVIPDTIEMVQCSIFSGQTALTQITVGSNVNRFTGTLTPGTNIKNLIFRQPAGMVIELPEAGKDCYGLGYNKDSYSINIYTDNEYIKNYDWAADNVTATFYPLSEAPA